MNDNKAIVSSINDLARRVRRLDNADTYKPLVVNVQSKGAVGDGVTDDSEAIQAAIDSVATPTLWYGGEVYFPKGVYRIATGLILPSTYYRGISLIGEGRRTSQLYADAGVTLLTYGTDDGNYNDYMGGTYGGIARIEHLGFKGRWSPSTPSDTSRGIVDWGGGSMTVNDVRFVNLNYGFWGINSDVNSWRDAEFSISHYGVVLELRSDQNQFHDCLWTETDHPVVLRNSANCHIQSSVFAFCVGYPDIDVSNDSTALGGASNNAGYHVFSDNWHEMWSAMGTKPSFIDLGINGDGVVHECRIIRPLFMNDAPVIPDYYIKAGPIRGLSINDPMFNQLTGLSDPLLWVSDASAVPLEQHIVIRTSWLRNSPPTALVTLDGSSTAHVFVDAPEEQYYVINSSLTSPRFIVRKLGDTEAHVDLGTHKFIYGTAAPLLGAGTWVIGDIIINSSPVSGGTIGWVCTAAGDPGTWKTFGAIA